MPTKKKIMIAEDEEGIRTALAIEFRKVGFDVIEVTDGQLALHIAMTNHPDLLILDFFMPRMHGKNVLKYLLRDSWGAKVPVIVFTSYNIDVEVEQIIEEKEQIYYLDKTKVNLSEVVIKVTDILKA